MAAGRALISIDKEFQVTSEVDLLAAFHPSVRDNLAVWLEGLPDVGVARDHADMRADRVATIRRFPAHAVMVAHGVAWWRAADRGLCDQPVVKFGLKSRLGTGVKMETPAKRLRVKVGRKYITTYAVPEETEEKLAT